MALNRVDLGIQYFPQFAADRAIANAQIYIGQPNLDPAVLANQIQAYIVQENGTQVAVPQPIRTGAGGVPTYNGSPVEIAVNELQYSLKILNSTGSQIYYKSIVNGSLTPTNSTINLENYTALRAYFGDANTVYITGVLATAQPQGIAGVFQYDETDVTSADNGGTIIVGSDGRRWKRVSPDFVTPEMFGAVGDGVANDSTALQNSIQFASDFGAEFKGLPKSTYLNSSGINIARDNDSHPLIMDFNGATVINNESQFLIGGQTTAQYKILDTTFTVEPSRGDAFLQLASVVGVQQGDLVEILSPAITQGTVSTLHYYPVAELDGNNLYIEGTVVADVKTQQIIDSGQVGTITVSVYRPTAGVSLRNLNSIIVNATGASLFSFYPQFEKFVTIENCDFFGKTRFQVGLQYNVHCKIRGCNFKDMGYLTKDGNVNEPASPGGLSFGYGILMNRTFNVLISDCTADRGWHMGDSSRGTMTTQYQNCYFARNAYGVSSHEGAWYMYVKDCVFDGNQGITCGRNAYTYVDSCHFRHLKIGHGIVYSAGSVEVSVTNCTFTFLPTALSAVFAGNIGTPGAGVISVGFPRLMVVKNNQMYNGRCDAGFRTDNDSATVVFEGNYFRSNGSVNIYCNKETSVKDNVADNLTGQFMFIINLLTGNPKVYLGNNTHNGGVTTFAGSAMFSITGTTTDRFIVKGNRCQLQYITRFNSGGTMFLMDGNTNTDANGRGSLGGGTITNVINNSWRLGFSDGSSTAVNSVNNTTLTL